MEKVGENRLMPVRHDKGLPGNSAVMTLKVRLKLRLAVVVLLEVIELLFSVSVPGFSGRSGEFMNGSFGSWNSFEVNFAIKLSHLIQSTL